jgi:hypothetical protein
VSDLVRQARPDREQPAVQRQPAAGSTAPAHAGGPDVGSALSVRALESIRVTATQSSFLAGAYAEKGLRTVDALKSSLTMTSGTYGKAYAEYATIVRAGRAEAVDQQDLMNIFLGIGIGTGVGLLSTLILPEGLAVGWTVLAEVLGEAAEAGLGKGAQKLGITDVAGTDLEPGGLDPAVLDSQIWQRLSGLYRSVVGVQRHTQYLPLILGAAEHLLGQFRLVDAGAEADMTRPALVDEAISLNRTAAHLTKLNAALRERLDGLNRLAAEAAAGHRYQQDEMERDIWVMWMSRLTDDQSDILDLDVIEDHLHATGVLGPNGVLGVDFGRYTSEEDERAAIAAARRRAGAIHARYAALGGR